LLSCSRFLLPFKVEMEVAVVEVTVVVLARVPSCIRNGKQMLVQQKKEKKNKPVNTKSDVAVVVVDEPVVVEDKESGMKSQKENSTWSHDSLGL
jgi:hypothetical protein